MTPTPVAWNESLSMWLDAAGPDVKRAYQTAKQYHASQLYGEYDYTDYHCVNVAMITSFHTKDVAVINAAMLHDSIEDTDATYNTIKQLHGKRTADIVYAVSDAEGPSRAWRKAQIYHRIRSTPGALLVKLADRVVNVESGAKREMYAKEHPSFVGALWEPNNQYQSLWDTISFRLFGVSQAQLFKMKEVPAVLK